MDSLLGAAARALAAGDALGALKCVALRHDPPALALRGIALAQLGDFTRARRLLVRAERAFGSAEAVSRARCIAARAEVELASRELSRLGDELREAAEVLEKNGEPANAMFARLTDARRLLLLGDADAAERALAPLELAAAPPHVAAVAALVAADIALRRLRTGAARTALERARRAARISRIAPLIAEVDAALTRLDAPAARLSAAGVERVLTLGEIEKLQGSADLVVDACRREVRAGSVVISLASRPVLLALATALAARAPDEASREALVLEVFAARRMNESHRARLRVEIGRLRKALSALAELSATPNGFALAPRKARGIVLLRPVADGEASELLALLAGGEAWSTSGLAAALGTSQRSVQRALGVLEGAGQVRAVGHGRARRWVIAPSTGFATTLLLVARSSVG